MPTSLLTLNIRNQFRSYSTEYACSEGTQTPSSEVDCEFPDPFQTEKLLKTSFELESDQGENIFNAFVKVRFRFWCLEHSFHVLFSYLVAENIVLEVEVGVKFS